MTEPFITDPYNSRPGDIDVLLSDRKHPHMAVALECKKLRIRADTFNTGQIGGLKKAVQGFKQANGLFDLGFSRSYLALLIEVDGRERTKNNLISRGATPELYNEIFKIRHVDGLYQNVGIILVEIIQPTKRDIKSSGSVGFFELKQAKPQMQSESTTTYVRNYFAHAHDGS